MRIVIVEDDAIQLEYLGHLVASAKHSFQAYDCVNKAIDFLGSHHTDLVLVDWMLPDGTGADLLKWVRQSLGWELPIIVVTSVEDESVICAALNAGADDYIVKPAKPKELLARIAALARRSKQSSVQVLDMGPYQIDLQSQVLRMNGSPVAMTQKEFDMSFCLFQSPGKLLSRDHLLNKVWGLNTEVDTRTVDTHASRLRKKLHLDGSLGWKLVSVYGYGYRFDRTESPKVSGLPVPA